MNNFRIGDKVSTYDGKTGVITSSSNDINISVFFDEPEVFGGGIITKRTYRYNALKLIEDRKRILNLDLDPFGEENW